jgi:serine kinase of HPr protein (carbohydrate metabolism regulator)
LDDTPETRTFLPFLSVTYVTQIHQHEGPDFAAPSQHIATLNAFHFTPFAPPQSQAKRRFGVSIKMARALSSETIHATSVAIGGQAVLLAGPSGSGKSDLALRLIDRGAVLISDDYTLVTAIDGRLIATAPATIIGKIEVRGIGIVDLPHVQEVPVALLIELVDAVERMPQAPLMRTITDIDVPVTKITPHEPSAPIKAELALKAVTQI